MSSNSGNQCPYCDRVLVDKPKRKTKCPYCKKFIFVRGGQLVTEEQAQIVDWLKRLEQWGLNEQEFQKHKEVLAIQFGHQPKVNDVIWRFLNSRVNNPIDYFTNKIMYQEMAMLVLSEGKDPRQYLAEAAKQALLELKASGTKQVTVLTCNDGWVCSECENLTKQVFTIEEALKTLPIPNICTRKSGCRCGYWPAEMDYGID